MFYQGLPVIDAVYIFIIIEFKAKLNITGVCKKIAISKEFIYNKTNLLL